MDINRFHLTLSAFHPLCQSGNVRQGFKDGLTACVAAQLDYATACNVETRSAKDWLSQYLNNATEWDIKWWSSRRGGRISRAYAFTQVYSCHIIIPKYTAVMSQCKTVISCYLIEQTPNYYNPGRSKFGSLRHQVNGLLNSHFVLFNLVVDINRTMTD